MSPDKARVFVAEDRKSWQLMIKEILEEAGHQVVLSATSLPDALLAINLLAELKVNVAILDGNLSEWAEGGDDGQEVLKAIRERNSEIITVGMSAFPFKGVDFDLGKTNIIKVGETITKL